MELAYRLAKVKTEIIALLKKKYEKIKFLIFLYIKKLKILNSAFIFKCTFFIIFKRGKQNNNTQIAIKGPTKLIENVNGKKFNLLLSSNKNTIPNAHKPPK